MFPWMLHCVEHYLIFSCRELVVILFSILWLVEYLINEFMLALLARVVIDCEVLLRDFSTLSYVVF